MMVPPKAFWLSFLVALVALTGVPLSADAQIFVYPRRPNQSNVRYFDFEWRHIEILVGPEAEGDADGVSPGHGGDSLPLRQGAGTPGRSDAPYSRWFDSRLPGVPSQTNGLHAEATVEVGTDEILETPPPPTVPGEELGSPSPKEGARAEALLDETSGGVRLYFYERERDVAERAAAFIDESYRYLVEVFDYVPTRTLPYILYNSYQEFLQTNIFPIQEGVLGVTSRRDLKLILPYFGDHRLFQHVSTHEMVHQFTIQKARDVANEAGVSGDPLDRVPLWYIEGIAEYYAHRGLDPETEMLARDLLLNPDPMRGFVMLDFFEDRPFSGLWTYKIGQARVAFLEEVYGAGTAQRILNESHRLVPKRRGEEPVLTFRGLLVSITGDEARTISGKFETWLKRRSYSTFLRSGQDSPDVIFFNETQGIVQTMSSAQGGHLLMYRSIQPETGQVRLYLADAREPARHRRVAGDGVPGVESLHPVGGRTFDVHTDHLVFVARSEGRDVLYLQGFDHRAERAEPDEDDEAEKRPSWDVRLRLGKRQAYKIGEKGLLAAESPSFSPNGEHIAFVGLDEDGQKDIYIFTPLEDGEFLLTRLTEDIYAERSLSWGPQGIVYASDATGHGRYNLFLLDPARPDVPTRLTHEDRDHFDARTLDDGRLLFSAYDGGRANIYEWTEEGIIRRTDIVTGLFDTAPGPGGSVWALFHHRGQRQPVRIPSARFLSLDVETAKVDTPPQVFPTRSLEDDEAYRAFAVRNWEISNIFGILGASGSGVFGQLVLLTNDRLRNHAFFLNVLAFGSWESTQADLTYLNQEHRLIWGAGAFQDVRYRIDQSLEDVPRFLSGERFYGVRGTARYPLNRFLYVQGDLGVGGVSFFLPQGTQNFLEREEELQPGRALIDTWRDANEGMRFQTSPSLSLGYNTIRYHPGTGPIDGSSALLATTVNLQPFDNEVHGHVRLDGERYFPIHGRINLSLRSGVGTTYGGRLARQFFLSSFDTLRGVDFGDIDYLLGNRFGFTKLELRFPMNWLVRIPIIDVEGLLGSDFGGVGDDFAEMWRWRALAFVTGFNFGLGPLVFRLHFARPIDIGAPRLPRDGGWITNFSLGWRYW
ncbi:MAG: tolB protein precursor protein [Bradymonadaceae bacterium]